MNLMIALAVVAIAFVLIVIVLLVFVLKPASGADVAALQRRLESIERGQERGEREFRDEVARNREEARRPGPFPSPGNEHNAQGI